MIDVTNCEIKDREGGVIQEKQRLGWKEDKWTRQVGEYWANVVACVFFPALSDHFFEHELIISRLAHLPNLQSISAPQSINHSYLALLILSQKSKHSSSTRNLISPSLTQRITSISKSSVSLIACSSLLEPEISSPSDMWFLLIFAYPSLVLPSRVLPIVRSLCERHQNGRVCDFFHSIFLFILRGKVFVVQKLQYVLFVHLFEKRSREEEDTCVTLRHPTFFCYYIRRTLKVFTPKYTKKMSNLDPRVVPIISGQMMNATVLTFLGMFKYKSYYSHPTMNQDHHQMLYQAIRKLIPPPNPIITKHIQPDLPAEMIAHSLPVLRAVDLHSEDQEELKEEECTLSSAYSRHDLVFQRWQRRNNTRNNVTYFASNFCERNNKENLLYIGQLQDNCLEFDCNFDSGNLLAAYKTGEAQYDLILQNDLNSGGYTQWFNFTVSNFKQKGTIKFNIVNFYKKDSLFKEGMKPITRSLVHDKNWKRSCHNIEYFISEMRMQGRKSKCYKILSFKYDFIFQSDTVQFAYCLPYSYQKLNNFLKTLNSSKPAQSQVPRCHPHEENSHHAAVIHLE